jgi:glutamyl endopeptidase
MPQRSRTRSTRARSATRDAGHTAVSNIPRGRAAARRQVAQPTSQGRDSKTNRVRSDGTEEVEGYKAATAAAPAKLWTPPSADLPDIGEASFGKSPSRAEIVHGPDDRVQITNTTIYPWRAIASLVIKARDNSMWVGTGWFISPRTLITAGHCVYIKNSGVPGRDGWAKSINVMPGRNGSNLPFGSVTSTSFRSVRGWTEGGKEEYDYGAIIIPTELGSTVGTFGFAVYSDSELGSVKGNISGYPGDKPSGTQWYDARQIASVGARKVYYDIDTVGGQSGSAVFRNADGKRIAIAVHAYGGEQTNSGTRISSPVYNNMMNWKK